MPFTERCKSSHPSWTEKYADAFSFEADNGERKTVFRYSIPFPEAKDAIIQQKFSLSHAERLSYYQTLAQCVSRNIEVINFLKTLEIPSILTCESVSQNTDPETGRSCVYVQTEEVKPILTELFGSGINILTLLDVFLRLSVIIRDLSGCGVYHRAITLDQLYLNAEGKILMGGFYYTSTPQHSQPIPYLPDHPRHLPPVLLHNSDSSAAADMQTLARMLYNCFAGLPWDTKWPITPKTVPAYAPEGLAEILRFGMSCTDEDCNAFRRQLLNFRKELSKSDLAAVTIPIRRPLKKVYTYR